MKNTTSDIDGKSTSRFNLWLAIITVTVLLVPNVMLCFTEHMSAGASIANVLIPAGFYSFLLFAFRNTGRTVLLMLPFFILAAFQIVLLGLYGRSIIAVDMFLNVMTTNPGEAGELLGNLIGPIAFVCVLYLPPIVLAIVSVSKGNRLQTSAMPVGKYAGFAMAFTGVLSASAVSISGNYSASHDLFPANVIHNMSIAMERESKINNYHNTSRDFAYNAKNDRPESERQLYVLVVGETSRADSWQLAGYQRPTNPRLSLRKKNMVMLDHAMSESNTTHKSVPLMLSPLDSRDYEDKIYSVKGIISAFKEAGFATAYVSNQERNHGFIDFFGEEADTCLFIKDHPELFDHNANDLVMNNPIDSIIENAADRQLIVVHTYGSHFDYSSRYDDRFRKFLPDEIGTPDAANRESIVNAYDNTLLVTDAFLDNLIASVERHGGEGAVLYAADHGEDIFDDSRHLFLHASPCPSYYQLHVPMFAWFSDDYATVHQDKVNRMHANRHRNVSTSASYFHTALDLAGISTGYFDPSQSVASSVYKEPAPAYLNDHNEKVDLLTAGFGPQDFRMMPDSPALTSL